MKGILRFNLDDPDDRQAFERAINVEKYIESIEDLLRMLRNHTKYGFSTPERWDKKTPIEVMEYIYESFLKILEQNGVEDIF